MVSHVLCRNANWKGSAMRVACFLLLGWGYYGVSSMVVDIVFVLFWYASRRAYVGHGPKGTL